MARASRCGWSRDPASSSRRCGETLRMRPGTPARRCRCLLRIQLPAQAGGVAEATDLLLAAALQGALEEESLDGRRVHNDAQHSCPGRHQALTGLRLSQALKLELKDPPQVIKERLKTGPLACEQDLRATAAELVLHRSRLAGRIPAGRERRCPGPDRTSRLLRPPPQRRHAPRNWPKSSAQRPGCRSPIRSLERVSCPTARATRYTSAISALPSTFFLSKDLAKINAIVRGPAYGYAILTDRRIVQ